MPNKRHLRRLLPLGYSIVVPSTVYFVLGIVGLVPTDFLSIGDGSGLRSIGAIAVSGCLITAIGYWDE